MKTLFQLLRGLTLGLPSAVRAVLAWLAKSGRWRPLPCDQCNTLSGPIVSVPDPLIYDQYYLWSLGLPFSWSNPDITIWFGAAEVAATDLAPATTYEVVARIWNSSTTAPIAGLNVAFAYLSFGVGVQSNPIGHTAVNLGVKGGPDQPAFARMLWTTPATPGHYCIQVLLEPFSDSNWSNNLGQENTQVVATQSPAVSTFALRNDTDVRQAYEFRADAYQLLPVNPCPPAATTERAPREDPVASRLAFVATQPVGQPVPVPAGWLITTMPERPEVAPLEEITVQVTIEPPVGFLGTQPINIHAFRTAADGSIPRAVLAGGVTLMVSAS
jgi:hypothetical protein